METTKQAALYLGDNGRCFCANHGGATFRASGRDLSGQSAYELKAADFAEAQKMGAILRCESCK